MKKFLMFICTLILTLGLFGCDAKVANADDYTIDKEVEITEELSFDAAKEKVEELEEAESKYLSYDMKMTMEGSSTTAKFVMIEEKGGVDGSMTMNMDMGIMKMDIEMYIKDNFVFMEFPGVGKIKAKIPTTEDLDDFTESGMEGVEEYLEEFYKLAAEHSDKVKVGYDKAGCLILEYADENAKLRFVFDKNYPVYFYVGLGTEMVTEMKFSYDKVEVEYPEDFKAEDYKEINWEEFENMDIM